MGFLDALFGSKPKTYPVLRADMLQPVDNKITTQEAKRIFKEWMLKIGYLDKQEVGDHVGYFADEMREHEQGLREDVQQAKADLAEEIKLVKEDIKGLKAQLKSCKPEEKPGLEAELEDSEKELLELTSKPYEDLVRAEKALEDFKADMRDMLVKYINQQVHGDTSNY